MRESDKIKEARSYHTVWNQAKGAWTIEASTWLPGYTSGHKATVAEALQYRIDLLNLEKKSIDSHLFALGLALHELRD